MNKLQQLKSYLENQKKEWKLHQSSEAKYRMEVYNELLGVMDSLQEEEPQAQGVFYGLSGTGEPFDYEHANIQQKDFAPKEEPQRMISAKAKEVGYSKPANKDFTFKSIPRILEMVKPSERSKSYCEKLAKSLEHEGYSVDAKIVSESIKIMNGEKVPMATMDEEPVSDDLEEELRRWWKNKYSSVDKKYTFDRTSGHFLHNGTIIELARHFAQWQEEKDKHVLKEEGLMIVPDEQFETMKRSLIKLSEEKEKMMKDAVDAYVASNFGNDKCIRWDTDALMKAWCNYEVGTRLKVIIIKEE